MAVRCASRHCLASPGMELPPPAVAFDISRSFHTLSEAVGDIGSALDATILGLRRDWHGPAANAAATLLTGLLDGAHQAITALDQAAGTWNHLGHDLTWVHRKIEAVDLIDAAANGVAIVSLLQLGLDPVSDAAAVAARAGATAGLAAAKTALREAIERAVSRVAVDNALLTATRIVGVYAGKSIITGSVETGIARQFEYGSVPWARLAAPHQLIADLVPRQAAAVLVLEHTDLALPAPVPPCFADRSSYEEARTVAADWSARSIGGTQVSIDAGPHGTARVVIHGASAPLVAGRTYSAAEVESLDVDLARTLDRIAVFADAPVTVVAER